MDLTRLPTIGYDEAPSLTQSAKASHDPDIPYSGSFYYNPSAASDLAGAITGYILNDRRTLEWNPADHNQSFKHFYNRLNAAKSYIINHPDDFAPDVVTELKATYFAKRGILYVLARERAKTTSLSSTANYDRVVYRDPTEQPIASDPIVEMPTKDYLPQDGDIETLLLNIDSWKATAAERQMFEREGIRLSPESLGNVRAKFDDKFIGRAEHTRIRIVRVA